MKKEKVTIPCPSETIAGVTFRTSDNHKKPTPCLIGCHGAFEYKESLFALADTLLNSTKIAYDPAINQLIISGQRLINAYSVPPLLSAAPCAFVDTIKHIHTISIPTLVMQGEDDHIEPPKTAEMLFEALTCKKSLEFLPKSGHCGHLDKQKNKMMQLTADWVLEHL